MAQWLTLWIIPLVILAALFSGIMLYYAYPDADYGKFRRFRERRAARRHYGRHAGYRHHDDDEEDDDLWDEDDRDTVRFDPVPPPSGTPAAAAATTDTETKTDEGEDKKPSKLKHAMYILAATAWIPWLVFTHWLWPGPKDDYNVVLVALLMLAIVVLGIMAMSRNSRTLMLWAFRLGVVLSVYAIYEVVEDFGGQPPIKGVGTMMPDVECGEPSTKDGQPGYWVRCTAQPLPEQEFSSWTAFPTTEKECDPRAYPDNSTEVHCSSVVSEMDYKNMSSPELHFPEPGDFVVKYYVTDVDGNESQLAEISVEIERPAAPPPPECRQSWLMSESGRTGSNLDLEGVPDEGSARTVEDARRLAQAYTERIKTRADKLAGAVAFFLNQNPPATNTLYDEEGCATYEAETYRSLVENAVARRAEPAALADAPEAQPTEAPVTTAEPAPTTQPAPSTVPVPEAPEPPVVVPAPGDDGGGSGGQTAPQQPTPNVPPPSIAPQSADAPANPAPDQPEAGNPAPADGGGGSFPTGGPGCDMSGNGC